MMCWWCWEKIDVGRSWDLKATRTSLKKWIFHSLSRLFLPTYFVKCRRTLLKLNSEGPFLSSAERENFVVACLRSQQKQTLDVLMSLVMQKRQRNVQKVLCTTISMATSFPGFSPTHPRAGRREPWERGWLNAMADPGEGPWGSGPSPYF